MKTFSLISAGLALLLAGIPQTAKAGSRERAFVAGVVGGVVISNTLSGSHPYAARHSRTVHVREPSCSRSTVVRSTYLNAARSNSYLTEQVVQTGGYYKVERERVWVPGYREKVRTACGRWVVREVPGYYEFQNRRVWVPESRVVVSRPARTRVVYVR